MLYKFKSAAGADLIMLEASGRQILGLIGKDGDRQGILLASQMPAAKAALEAAIALEESQAKADTPAKPEHDDPETEDKMPRISLRSRAWPFVMLIEQSMKADVPMTWGV